MPEHQPSADIVPHPHHQQRYFQGTSDLRASALKFPLGQEQNQEFGKLGHRRGSDKFLEIDGCTLRIGE